MSNVKTVHTILAKGRYLVTLRNGMRAFIKVNHSDSRARIRGIQESEQREKTCLEVLEGLAVPKLLTISPRSLGFLNGIPKTSFFACSAYDEAKNLDSAGLTPLELLGAWIFIAEQLTAFRRHQIVYHDIKCSNALVKKNPLRIWLVDFECAAIVERSGRTIIKGFTPSFAAPETIQKKATTERSLVYELGMLLAHVLARTNNDSLRRWGLGKALRETARLEASGIGRIMAECLAADPKRRPRNFEEVLRRVRATRIPDPALVLWHWLRAPYARRLAEVGLM